MKKVLYILGEFEDGDAEWIATSGIRRGVGTGEVLIREGETNDFVYFVTHGSFSVTTGPENTELARVGSGEVLGEISYVDRRPPTATVTAAEDSRVLALAKPALTEKLHGDPGFASRFYRAIAVFLAHRLRTTVRQVGGEDGFPEGDEELDLEALDTVSKAGVRFERILQRIQEV